MQILWKKYSNNGKCLTKHESNCISKENTNHSETTASLAEIFPFCDEYFSPALHEKLFYESSRTYDCNYINEFKANINKDNFNCLLINFNSIFAKLHELHIILETKLFELILLNILQYQIKQK